MNDYGAETLVSGISNERLFDFFDVMLNAKQLQHPLIIHWLTSLFLSLNIVLC